MATGLRLLPNCSMIKTNTKRHRWFGTFIVATGLRYCTVFNTNTTIDNSFGTFIVAAGLCVVRLVLLHCDNFNSEI